MVVLLLVAFITICLMVDLILIRRKKAILQKSPFVKRASYSLREENLHLPKGVHFDSSHTWTFLEPSGIAKIGMDDFLHRTLGKISYSKLLKNGDHVSKGDPLFSVESNGKTLSLISPISGKIHQVNDLENTPGNHFYANPYDSDWVYEVEPEDWLTESLSFMNGGEALTWMKCEFARLRDFFMVEEKKADPSQALILQDGGMIARNVLQYRSADIWSAFQEEFLS